MATYWFLDHVLSIFHILLEIRHQVFQGLFLSSQYRGKEEINNSTERSRIRRIKSDIKNLGCILTDARSEDSIE